MADGSILIVLLQFSASWGLFMSFVVNINIYNITAAAATAHKMPCATSNPTRCGALVVRSRNSSNNVRFNVKNVARLPPAGPLAQNNIDS